MTNREPWRVSTKNGLDSDQAVEDAIGQCGIPDLVVPVGDRQLTGEGHGSVGVTIGLLG